MLFNNPTKRMDFYEALGVENLFNDVHHEGVLVPPPAGYFLLDNTGDALLDNTDEPFLVSLYAFILLLANDDNSLLDNSGLLFLINL